TLGKLSRPGLNLWRHRFVNIENDLVLWSERRDGTAGTQTSFDFVERDTKPRDLCKALGASGERQEAVLGQHSSVPRLKPATLGIRKREVLSIRRITHHPVGALVHDVALDVCGLRDAIVIDDRECASLQCQSDARAVFWKIIALQGRNSRASLRLSIHHVESAAPLRNCLVAPQPGGLVKMP